MRKLPLAIGIASALLAGYGASPAQAEEHDSEMLKDVADNTSLTLSGTVIESREDEFDLMVGTQTVTIEVEDEIRDGGAYTLSMGDQVTATGRVDDDLFEGKELKAEALYIDKLGTTFIIDEDYADKAGMVSGRFLRDYAEVSGTVTSVAADDSEFRIHGGTGDFTVEVDELPENPLDDEGYLRIDAGDAVTVSGPIDDDWFEGREIVANSLSVVHLGVVID